jgi:hemoglobin
MSDAPDTVYVEIGGEAGVRALVDAFYDRMDSDPSVAPLRAMHASNLTASREKLFWFLSGWLGGPPLYMERKGHPRLRARHLPFAIDDDASQQWMRCMRVALATTTLSTATRERLDTALAQLAAHMRNQPG